MQQDGAAVLVVAPDAVQRRVGLGLAVGRGLGDQPAGEQRAHHLGRGAAAERAGKRQDIAVVALRGGAQDQELGVGKLGHRSSPSHRGARDAGPSTRSSPPVGGRDPGGAETQLGVVEPSPKALSVMRFREARRSGLEGADRSIRQPIHRRGGSVERLRRVAPRSLFASRRRSIGVEVSAFSADEGRASDGCPGCRRAFSAARSFSIGRRAPEALGSMRVGRIVLVIVAAPDRVASRRRKDVRSGRGAYQLNKRLKLNDNRSGRCRA